MASFLICSFRTIHVRIITSHQNDEFKSLGAEQLAHFDLQPTRRWRWMSVFIIYTSKAKCKHNFTWCKQMTHLSQQHWCANSPSAPRSPRRLDPETAGEIYGAAPPRLTRMEHLARLEWNCAIFTPLNPRKRRETGAKLINSVRRRVRQRSNRGPAPNFSLLRGAPICVSCAHWAAEHNTKPSAAGWFYICIYIYIWVCVVYLNGCRGSGGGTGEWHRW